MEGLKLTINMLPKGAWNNDFSKRLSKKIGTNYANLHLKEQMEDAKYVDIKLMPLTFMKNGNLILKRKRKL